MIITLSLKQNWLQLPFVVKTTAIKTAKSKSCSKIPVRPQHKIGRFHTGMRANVSFCGHSVVKPAFHDTDTYTDILTRPPTRPTRAISWRYSCDILDDRREDVGVGVVEFQLCR